MERVHEREADPSISLRAALVVPRHLVGSHALVAEPAFSSTWATIDGVRERLRQRGRVADVVAVAVGDRDHVDALGRALARRASSGSRSGTDRRRCACRGRSRSGTPRARARSAMPSIPLSSRTREHRRTVRPGREAMASWDAESSRLSSPARRRRRLEGGSRARVRPLLSRSRSRPSRRCGAFALPRLALRRRSRAPGRAVGARGRPARPLVRRPQPRAARRPAARDLVGGRRALGVFALKGRASRPRRTRGGCGLLRPAKP